MQGNPGEKWRDSQKQVGLWSILSSSDKLRKRVAERAPAAAVKPIHDLAGWAWCSLVSSIHSEPSLVLVMPKWRRRASMFWSHHHLGSSFSALQTTKSCHWNWYRCV